MTDQQSHLTAHAIGMYKKTSHNIIMFISKAIWLQKLSVFTKRHNISNADQ